MIIQKLLKLFLKNIAAFQRQLMYTQNGAEASSECMKLLRECWDNITLYNQTPVSAFEILLRDISHLNIVREGVFKPV